MDPFGDVGFSIGTVSADIITVSHGHDDHSNVKAVSSTSRREKPFVIAEPGEYEIEGISVFGYQSSHDGKKGDERGENVLFVVQIEGIRVLHLGDLGHELSDSVIETLNGIDVLLVPVGGFYTIDSKQALKVIESISPSIAIPMHYKTDKHGKEFEKLSTLGEFVKLYGSEPRKVEDKLSVSSLSIGEDITEVVVFN